MKARRTQPPHGSPSRRYELRYTCTGPHAGSCRACTKVGHHIESRTGDLARAKDGVLYMQRRDQRRRVWIFDSWEGRDVDFKGYDIHIWRTIDGDHRLEAWGDPSYRAPTACEQGGGTFSLLLREGDHGRVCRLLFSGLPLSFLWPLRDAAGALLSEENCASFARWAVRQLRDATLEQIHLLGPNVCSVADWPGAVPIENIIRPAA